MGILFRLIGRVPAALAGVMLFCGAALADCAPGLVDIRGDFGTVRFRVELARTPEEQARGLMFREEMPRLSGMLFVYDRPRDVAFWMRNTLIPLDMIFLDAAGRIARIHENAVPLDETPIRAGAPTLAVLEINGGMAATLGLDAGDELRSPAMPQDAAAWPCD
ncbi:DUF192 domain-containing protein [Jannaschia sp. S6380]|uniref:DUF192 domain-containing protein n=1 Tax=Jannaschia sp. S6380 TaxID=2926408 RepID=UPI001FF1AD7C|nr:DUF192 domain-containing protein [Jannaschia sp. S6380]MCK0166532.1 DUF192 domain-containing protein [Jannaschia sp. S6380]